MSVTVKIASKNDCDPIAEANERENDYWQSIGGRTDGVTEAVGWNERWELMLKELP